MMLLEVNLGMNQFKIRLEKFPTAGNPPTELFAKFKIKKDLLVN